MPLCFQPAPDPSQRAALLQQLDNCWSDAADAYVPSPVEQYLLEALPGLSQHAVMMLAVQKPGLVSHDVDECVRPVIRALKDARILSLDISFLLGKRPELLGRPLPLQRWLDFLSVYGLGPKDTLNFLLRGSSRLLDEVTLFQAGAVVTFLKQLGIKDEYLASRVVCIWPDVLGRDVEAEVSERERERWRAAPSGPGWRGRGPGAELTCRDTAAETFNGRRGM